MRIPTTAAVAIVAGLALAGCGADADTGDSATGSQDRRQQAQDAALAYAKCMRENGVDMPDPQFDGGRTMQRGPDESTPPDKIREAEEACRKHLEAVEPPELSEEQQQEMKEAALAHAECMREHGIDMPDPQFDEDGGVQMRIGPGTGIDPESQEFQDAEKACRDELPAPFEEESQ